MDVIASWGLDLPILARFGVIMALAALVPGLCRATNLPNCVGFIAIGVLIGPHLLGLVPAHEATADFFAELGKLLLMFFVGMEVDLKQFNEHRRRAVLFGLLTFALPMATGTAAGLMFGYGEISAILIGSLLASHTLIAFPLVIAARLSGRPAVTVTVGATVLTDMLSLLVLAACLSAHQSGFDAGSLAIEVVQLVVFSVLIVWGLGSLGAWLTERLAHSEEARFALLLVIVCLAATAAEAIQLEGIIGAFLAGLAVNSSVRGTLAKERLEFMGQAFFIPAFFIVTGFLVDMTVLGGTLWQQPGLVVAIVGGLIASKWAAAQIAGRAWGFDATDRSLMASLTMPQVAATLAAALVGYQAVNAAGERLLDDKMLNTVLVLVVVTSVLGPILTARTLRRA